MPPIQIDKILSDPLLIVAAVLLVVSPVTFLVAFVKYLRAPRREPFAIPHNEMDSPIPSRLETSPDDVPSFAASEPEPRSPLSALEPMPTAGTAAADPEPVETPMPSPVAPAPTSQPAFPTPPLQRRPDTAAEKTVVMPAGMAEMQSEMEIAFSQLKLLNKRVASLELELSRLRSGGASGASGNPHPGV